MINWEKGFGRVVWNFVVILTAVTAYFAIERSYEGPYWDEGVLARYVFTPEQGRQQRDLVNSQKLEDSVRKNVIAEYNA